ncbi:hypothetical protein FE810_05440 [Thalassotalea litorea]|uniref:Uncharacterized protein n=1 Tax=Thalassotalea litorea TaxID=2020715 RepID=A0A5R9IKW4_9GAMM|nr:hypothetical protein [Thalassotalea litorea]TLU66164.1 hypothetical protein FE810_05440 [Thalassotalea litorea]
MKLFRILILSLCIGYCYANLIMAFELPVVKQLEHWIAGQMDNQEIPWKLYSGVLIAAIVPFVCAYLYARSQIVLVSVLSVVLAVHFVGNRQSNLWDPSGVMTFFEPLNANSVSLSTFVYLGLIIFWPLVFVALIQKIDKAVN